jgi:prolyl 4-hydroxylase
VRKPVPVPPALVKRELVGDSVPAPATAPARAPSYDGLPPTETGFDPRRIEVLSLDKPRAFVYHGFLSAEECDHMVAMSRNSLSQSGVVDAETGGSAISEIRTSSGAFLPRRADPTIAAIERRIALWSGVPEEHGEAMQVLRYERSQEYRAHFDYFFHKGGMGNNRVATVLLYLADVAEGGETVFPNTSPPPGRPAVEPDGWRWSRCAQEGVAVKPVKGNALLFWSMKVGGELDGGSSHAGCPVINGTKWTATKWMHVAPATEYDAHQVVFKEPRPKRRAGCGDKEERCFSWAEQGECKRNPGFMLTTCRASCDACTQPPYQAPPAP